MCYTDLFKYQEVAAATNKKEVQAPAKNDLSSLQWNILKYLKENALGKENAISGKDLAIVFNLENTSQVRYNIKKIRVSKIIDTVIGSDRQGYFIPYQDEYEKSMQLLVSKTFSMIETCIKQYPKAKDMLHKVVGYQFKTTNKAQEGQFQMQFNGWESEIINKFAGSYKEVK